MKKSTVRKIDNGVIVGSIIAIYWLIVTAVYGLVSFTTEAWNITWIVWPIAGAAFLLALLVCLIIKKGSSFKKYVFLFIIIATVLLSTGVYLLLSFTIDNIWAVSWVVFIGMAIAIFIEIIVFLVKKNRSLDESEVAVQE